MTTEYNEQIIQKFADSLYKQARSIEWSYALMGFLLGLVAVVGGAAVTGVDSSNSMPIALVVAILCALMGFMVARTKAFLLRLQAQQALCSVQIERNTRPK